MVKSDNQNIAFLYCSDLVKMVYSPTEYLAFSAYVEELQSDKEEFTSFSISLIFRSANVEANNFAAKNTNQSHHITYVNNIPQF